VDTIPALYAILVRGPAIVLPNARQVFSRLGLARRSNPVDFSPPTRDSRLTPAKYSPSLASPEGPAQ